MNKAGWGLFTVICLSVFLVAHARAQSQNPQSQNLQSTNQEPSATPRPANLAQLMKGTVYPASNVVFAAQTDNPADVPWAKDPNMATDPLASAYGKWEAVENSALAIAEVADLFALPGRKCTNGLDAPVGNADWVKFVQQLRDAGTTAYAAAQTKNQDKMIDAADVMTKACSNCHRRYRDKPRLADRCK